MHKSHLDILLTFRLCHYQRKGSESTTSVMQFTSQIENQFCFRILNFTSKLKMSLLGSWVVRFLYKFCDFANPQNAKWKCSFLYVKIKLHFLHAYDSRTYNTYTCCILPMLIYIFLRVIFRNDKVIQYCNKT